MRMPRRLTYSSNRTSWAPCRGSSSAATGRVWSSRRRRSFSGASAVPGNARGRQPNRKAGSCAGRTAGAGSKPSRSAGSAVEAHRLHPARADHRAAPGGRRASARVGEPAVGRRAHVALNRAPPGSDQEGDHVIDLGPRAGRPGGKWWRRARRKTSRRARHRTPESFSEHTCGRGTLCRSGRPVPKRRRLTGLQTPIPENWLVARKLRFTRTVWRQTNQVDSYDARRHGGSTI